MRSNSHRSPHNKGLEPPVSPAQQDLDQIAKLKNIPRVNDRRSVRDVVDLTKLSRIASQKPPPPRPNTELPRPPGKKPPEARATVISSRPKDPPPRVPPPPPPTALFTKDDLKSSLFSIQPNSSRMAAKTEPPAPQSPRPILTSSHSQQSTYAGSTRPRTTVASPTLNKPTTNTGYEKTDTSPVRPVIVKLGRWTFIEDLPPPRHRQKAL